MKDELIKYVMEKADQCYSDDFPIRNIENWIREFFNSYQPERSKREDSCKIQGHDWLHTPLSDVVDCRRCGALNTMET